MALILVKNRKTNASVLTKRINLKLSSHPASGKNEVIRYVSMSKTKSFTRTYAQIPRHTSSRRAVAQCEENVAGAAVGVAAACITGTAGGFAGSDMGLKHFKI